MLSIWLLCMVVPTFEYFRNLFLLLFCWYVYLSLSAFCWHIVYCKTQEYLNIYGILSLWINGDIYRQICLLTIYNNRISNSTTEVEPRRIPLNQMIAKTTIHLDYGLRKKLKHYTIDNNMKITVVTNAFYEYLDKRSL